MSLQKRYQLKWVFEAPDAIMACSVMKCREEMRLIFGGHDKCLYLMDLELNMICDITFDGWVRCIHAVDLDGDGCDEVLVGSGDGSCMVLKFDQEKEKFVAIMRYIADGMVTCCTAGDLNGDGNYELIFGCADKTLKIFMDITSNEPTFTLYYDSWVTQCTCGTLKLPDMKLPIQGLLVGTKNGHLQLLTIEKKKKGFLPNIIWQRDLEEMINVITVGDVTNDGFNDIVVSTNDSFIKILDAEGNNIRYIRVFNGKSISLSRPLAIIVDDIDGDNAKEIIAGCADGTLRVYHNTHVKSKHFKLKWKTKVSTSIKSICTIEDPEEDSINLIFGGYDRTLRNVIDYEYGKKPSLKVPQKVPLPTQRKLSEPIKMEIKAIPTNIREHVVKLFKERNFYLSKELLLDELIAIGYKAEKILTEIEQLIEEKIILQENLNVSVWKLTPDINETMLKPKESCTDNKNQLTEREKIVQFEMEEESNRENIELVEDEELEKKMKVNNNEKEPTVSKE